MNLKSFLSIIPGQDSYSTPCFWGIIHGPELYHADGTALGDVEIKELILSRLKMAYDKAVRKMENIKL